MQIIFSLPGTTQTVPSQGSAVAVIYAAGQWVSPTKKPHTDSVRGNFKCSSTDHSFQPQSLREDSISTAALKFSQITGREGERKTDGKNQRRWAFRWLIFIMSGNTDAASLWSYGERSHLSGWAHASGSPRLVPPLASTFKRISGSR